MAPYHPRTLAKTLSYIACHAPAEFGLFWDPDGTMPWKELYWALQEDSSLRFVRESTLRELTQLDLVLPFVLDGSRLRLRADAKPGSYPLAETVPERLYFACRRKHYPQLREFGITPGSRPWAPLTASRELALRLALRRDTEPLLVEVLAEKARSEGQVIYWAGADLYLVAALAARHLVFPLLRADRHAALTSRKKPETKSPRVDHPTTPGSFLVNIHHFGEPAPAKDGTANASKQKGNKKNDWKREAKKERHKRSL